MNYKNSKITRNHNDQMKIILLFLNDDYKHQTSNFTFIKRKPNLKAMAK